MIRLIKPAPSSTVVVNGAAGSIGSAVTQLLAADGHQVIGTAGPDNHDYLRGLGAVPAGYGEGLADELRTAAVDGIDAAVGGHRRSRLHRLRGGTAPRRPHRDHRRLRGGR
ncbi:hypothetical protein ABZ820_22345 [Streptomyces diacarni]|uniref:hypothetical protein n=1 Tax=Streptomyces diacarni TaxID=2800381 RepID=UPI0033EF6137